MPQYRRKPAVLEATQWFRNGDHPFDDSKPVDTAGSSTTLTEGKVVKFFRRLHIPGDRICSECGNVMHKHGLIDGLNDEEEIVHPGDYIVTQKTHGHFYRRSSQEFEAMFEPYDPKSPKAKIGEVILDLDKRLQALEDVRNTAKQMVQ